MAVRRTRKLPGKDAGQLNQKETRIVHEPAAPTTVQQTIRRGEAVRQGSEQPYYALEAGPGEVHQTRSELAPDAPAAEASRSGERRSIAYLAHLTDIQLTDVQSPARLEAMHQLGRRPDTALLLPMMRPQELLAAHATDALVRALNKVAKSPDTGAPLQLAITTGDNVDNMQWNEVQSFLSLLDGGEVCMDSGGPDFEGVQDGRFPWAWAPEDPENLWGRAHGFPHVPGLLKAGLEPFMAAGLDVPWLTCYGNHDGLVQGRAPLTPQLGAVMTGHRKVHALPPGPVADFTEHPMQTLSGPSHQVTPDEGRRPVTREEFIEAHFQPAARPSGHGLAERNLLDGTAYYAYDGLPGIRVIVLDTTNPAGIFEGSIDRRQLAWLEKSLAEVHVRFTDADGREAAGGGDERLVIVTSHHPRTSMTNDRAVPAGTADAGGRALGEEVAAVLHRFPNVIAWVSGHIHRNSVRPLVSRSGGFWEISTSSVMDWPCQVRLLEIVDNNDGTLSILSTALDHEAPVRPDGTAGTQDLAAWHRELAANDPMGVGGFNAHGEPADRNVELLLPDPRVGRR